jgi:hypothetical protein
MDDPKLTINCLRCAKTAELSAQSARKENGEWKAVNAQRPAGWIQGSATEVSRGLCPKCADDWAKTQEAFLMPPKEVAPQEPARQIMTKPAASIGVIPVRATAFVDNTIPMDAPQGPTVFGVPMQAQRIIAPVIAPQMGQARIVPTSFAAQSIEAKPIIPIVQQTEPATAPFHPLPGIADRVVATPERVLAVTVPPSGDLSGAEVIVSEPTPVYLPRA